MDIKDIQNILEMLKQHEVHEFELEHDGTKIKLARGGTFVSAAVPTHQTIAIQPAIVGGGIHSAPEAVNGAVNPAWKKVESPIVGSFYRKSSPDSPNFVNEGDRVKKGSTLCIIEAMKVMNEIEAPCDGVVEKIIPSDGEVVEFGEVLFLINP